jgi:hypothetical protein
LFFAYAAIKQVSWLRKKYDWTPFLHLHRTRDVRQILRSESGEVVGIKNEGQLCYSTSNAIRRPFIWQKGKTEAAMGAKCWQLHINMDWLSLF